MFHPGIITTTIIILIIVIIPLKIINFWERQLIQWAPPLCAQQDICFYWRIQNTFREICAFIRQTYKKVEGKRIMPKEYYINTQCEEEKNFPKNDLRFRKGVYFTGYQRIIVKYLQHCLFYILVAAFVPSALQNIWPKES